MYDILYMQNLKSHDTNELIYKTEPHRFREGTSSYQGGRMGRGIVREFGDRSAHISIFNMDNQQGPTV